MRNFSPWRALAPVAIAAFSCAAAAQSSSQAPSASPGAQPDLRLDNRLPGSQRGDRDETAPRDPSTPDADNGGGLGPDNDPGANAEARPQPPENPANPPLPLFPANPKRPADPGQPGNPVTPTGARL